MNTIINTQFNNNTNFGMRYKNPKIWGRKTLQTFMESDLKRDIDIKYPNAIASYKIKTKKVSGFFEKKEYCHSLTFNLQLEKGKNWRYSNSTLNTRDLLDDMLSKRLNQTSLDRMEKEIEKEKQIKEKHQQYIKKAQDENDSYGTMSFKKIIDLLFRTGKSI